MKILSIETSCDDTCISILEMYGSFSARGGSAFGGKVLANNSNSQIKIHIPYGGVYPKLAKREHQKNLPIVLETSLREAFPRKQNLAALPASPAKGGASGLRHGLDFAFSKPPVDVIAVTYGPGLEMCLWEGIIFAKELAKKWNVPLIPVNHMEGHVFSVFGKDKGKFKIPKVKFPVLSLLVSGGHTQLILIPRRMSARGGSVLGGQYEIIGETLDDAVGEAFDKVARMLGLPYPGGPQISALAEILRMKTDKNLIKSNKNQVKSVVSLPRPMIKSRDFNFSFSGLKTAVLYLINPPSLKLRRARKIDDETKSKIALEFENAAIECLVYKTKKAIEKYKIKTLIVAGGVACNKHLQREMKKIVRQDLTTIKLLFPTKELSGDNSLMIGIAGYLNYIKNKKKVPKPNSIKAVGNLSFSQARRS